MLRKNLNLTALTVNYPSLSLPIKHLQWSNLTHETYELRPFPTMSHECTVMFTPNILTEATEPLILDQRHTDALLVHNRAELICRAIHPPHSSQITIPASDAILLCPNNAKPLQGPKQHQYQAQRENKSERTMFPLMSRTDSFLRDCTLLDQLLDQLSRRLVLEPADAELLLQPPRVGAVVRGFEELRDVAPALVEEDCAAAPGSNALET